MVRRERISLTDEMGKKIYEIVMKRDKSRGGIVLEALGIPGCGKTSLLLSIVDDIHSRYENELVFFRDSYASQCQFNRFDKWQIYAEKGVKLEFKNVDTQTIENVSITPFRDFKELLEIAQPQQLNVIYMKNNYRYIDFIRYLRLYPGWQSLVLDEYEDLAPQHARKQQWHKNQEMTFEFKHARRGLLNIFCDTQNPGDVFWTVRQKIMCHVYLQGSKVDHLSPIDQRYVNSLEIGELFIDYGHAFYGTGKFLPYEPKLPVLYATDLNNPF